MYLRRLLEIITVVAIIQSLTTSQAIAFVSMPPSDDTRIQTNNMNHNAGASHFLTLAGDHLFDFQRDLLRFRPEGQPLAISDGVLRLRIAAISTIDQVYDGRTAELFKIKASNGAWIEGTGDKRLAEEGEPSWNSRDLPNPWDGGPGLGANSDGSGMARPEDGYEGYGDLFPLSTYTAGPSIETGDIWEFTIPKELINDWINNPTENTGLLLRDSNEDSLLFDGVVVFASKENENQDGPTLTYACSDLGSDFDCNGDVDGADLAVWEVGLGINSFADGDGNGFSNGRDFLVWQREFGMRNSEFSAIATRIPEPQALLLTTMLLVLWPPRPSSLSR